MTDAETDPDCVRKTSGTADDNEGADQIGSTEAAALGFGRALVAVDHIRQNRHRVMRDFWPKLRRAAGRIPFAEDAAAAYFAAIDPKTPTRVKAVLMAALAYFVIPTDFIPDFIAGFGFTDDASVLTMAIAAMSGQIRLCHRQKAQDALMKHHVKAPVTESPNSSADADGPRPGAGRRV